VTEPYLAVVATECRPVTVPPGAVYVLGDDRPVARDSRHYGPVPEKQVHGRVLAKLWPPAQVG
jgi:signal peptidase I